MSNNDQPDIQFLSTNDQPTVQLTTINRQHTVQPTSTNFQSVVQPTPTNPQAGAQPVLTNGPPAVQAQPLLANSQCQPLAPNFRFCSGDIAAIVGAVVFVCYVVWGIPLTVRFYKYVRGRLAARRQRQLAMSQDLERSPEHNYPCGEVASASATLQGCHEHNTGHDFPPLDDKVKSVLDQRRLSNFGYPTADSWTSIPRSIQTVPRSPTQEFYSAPATPVPGYDESSYSHSSSPTTLTVPEEEKGEVEFAAESQDSWVPRLSMDHPFGRTRAICKPCMW